MRSFYAIVILFTATTLNAQTNNHITRMGAASAFEVQTFSESCPGQNNGSAYVRSGSTSWNLRIYRNAVLMNTLSVAGADTFVNGLAMGCYTFVYSSHDGSTDTVSKVLSAPPQIISLCRVHYLNRPHEDAVSFINLSSGGVAFDWDFGDGNHSAEISPVHVYALPGTYTVTLTAYNRSGCNAVSTYTVNVYGAGQTGMNGAAVQHPAAIVVESRDGSAHIASAGANSIAQINVYSLTGQLIYSGSGNDNKFSYAAPGLYTAHIVYADGQQESKNVPLN
jgi:hypothetical protein